MRGSRLAARVALLALLAIGVAAPPMPAPAQAQTPQSGLPDPLTDPAAFADPPMQLRPKTRWWWATPYDLDEFAEEVAAIADAGFGGVEAAFNADGWATEEQREALQVTLEAAEQAGITVDMTMGAGWPVTAPSVDAATGLSEQELQYGRRDLVGPSVFAGPPPPPMDGREGTLRAVTAARVITPGPPVLQPLPGPNLTPTGPTAAPSASTILDPESLVDLTGLVDASGSLTWEVPAGQWLLFGLWQRPSSENVMDHYSAESAAAVTGYLDEHQLGADAAALLPAVGGSFFEDSLELDVAELMWTHDFAEEFHARRGYDVTPYLPLLFVQGLHHYPVWETQPNADFDLPDGAGDRVRHDYLVTLTDLYVEQHLHVFQEWAQTHGMQFRTQAAFGAALDVTRSARELAEVGGIADDESLNAGDPATLTDSNWRFAMDHFRSVVGGVHQGGGREVSTELGAMFWREYQAGLDFYKAIMDKAWAAGVTTPIIHGFSYQPPGVRWPGRSNFFGIVAESWNHRHFPQWSMWRPLTDYWARGNLVLQQGRPQVDVAVYRDGFVTSAATFWALATDAANHQVDPALPAQVLTGPDGSEQIDDTFPVKPSRLFDGEALERAGYTFEYVDPEGLLEPAAAGAGVLYPDGPAYRALVVDQRSLPGEVATAIADAAEGGLAVVLVGDEPAAGTSWADPAAEDAAVAVAVARLTALPNVRLVPNQAAVRGALEDLGVAPAAEWSQDAPLYSTHRRGDGVDYFYVWNAADETVSVDAAFATSGAPSRLDLWTGEITPLGHYRAEGDRVVVPLTLAPGETTVLGFRHGAPPPLHVVDTDAEVVSTTAGVELRGVGAVTATLSDGTTATVTLPDAGAIIEPQTWQLHVDEVGPDGITPHDLELTELRDWREIDELEYASGTGTYTTTLTLPVDWSSADRGAYLDLGAVHGAVQVSLNGEPVAPDVVVDHRFDVTELLRPGDNQLEIVLTTTLKNRLVGLTRSGRPVGNSVAAQPATQPYGLRGPVQLVGFGRSVIIAAGVPATPFERLGGPTRVETAVALSARAFNAADDAVIASAANHPDALAASALAAELGAPILLTPPAGLHPAVAAELARLGAGGVHLVGGEDALSAQVADDLEAAGLDVTRVGGIDRFATAALVADEVARLGGPPQQAIIALGEHVDPSRAWPDALAAGNLAAVGRAPILLTRPDALPADTVAALDRVVGPGAKVWVVGGPDAVAAAAFQELIDAGYAPERLAGSNRYATAVAVVEEARRQGGGVSPILLASGHDWPDALAGAPAAAAQGGALVLVDPTDLAASPATAEWLTANAEPIAALQVAGGIHAISDAVAVDAAALVDAAPMPTATPARLCDETLVETSDGVRLHTWVSRLEPDQQRPVLLEIESYARPGNGCPTFLPGDYYPHFLSPEVIDRFTLVHVSYRGTGSSEGAFDLTGPDTQRDVREVIAWAAAQPWSTGEVVLTGQSGTGFAAHHGLHEPAVRAAVIYTSCADMYRCFRRGGTANGLSGVYLGVTEAGYVASYEDRRRLGTDANPPPPEQQAALADATAQTSAHTTFDGYWADRSALDALADVDIPVLYTTDAYDIVQPFDALQSTPNARLVLGMGHTAIPGIEASGDRHATWVRRYVDRFVAHYGLGDDNGAEHDPPVIVASNLGGVGGWRAGEAMIRPDHGWPLPVTDWTRLYLDAGPSGSAASINDGTLAAAPPAQGTDAAPILSAPGFRGDLRTAAWLAGSGARTDMRDDERHALTYTTPAFTRPVELTGPITLRLVASTTAPDVDWTVRLTDVWPDGRSEWITDGTLRATLRAVDDTRSLRNSEGEIVRPWLTFATPEAVPAGEPVEYLIDVIATANVFAEGHRLRLDILPVASGGPDAPAGGAGSVMVHRGAEGSSILLPLIPARCRAATPQLADREAPPMCARSWEEAVG